MQRFIFTVVLLMLAALLSTAWAQIPTPLPPPIAFEQAPLPPPAMARFPSSEHKLYAEVRGDSVAKHHLVRLEEADENASYAHPFEPVMDKGIDEFPQPETLPLRARHLSLRDAIVLALRNNPMVKTSELQRILDKFGLELALQPSWVQWTPLTVTSSLQNFAHPTWSAATGIAVNAPTGTSFSVANTNNLLGGPGVTTLNFSQHILKGFGLAVNDVPYEDAYDTENIARYTFKNNIIGVVVNVITSYRALVQSYNQLDADKRSLREQEQEYKIYKLEVKAGTLAPSDLLQQQETLESTRLSLVQEQNALINAYQTFLISLGLVPSSKFIIDRQINTANKRVPNLKTCIAMALKHNIAYRQELISLKITKRALITAEDARKWTLNVTSQVALGAQRSAVGQPIIPLDQSQANNPTLGVSLSIPIDNIAGKQGEVNAKIQIEDAELTLEQTKETLVSTVMTQLDAIHSGYKQIQIAQFAEMLQEKSLHNAKLKLKYGRTSMFEVTQLQSQLLSQQDSLISTEISYLNAITALYQTLGMTLYNWHIRLQY